MDALPNAPEPSLLSLSNAATPVDFLGQSGSPTTGRIADAKSTPEDPPETPVLTMFPHPEDARYWISGQANIIFQGRLPFHSLYEGTNSFRNSAEYKTSMVGTAYTALRRNRSVRYNTDFIFDMESAAGRGSESRRWGWRDSPTWMWCGIPILAHAVHRALPDSPGHRSNEQDNQPGAELLCASVDGAGAAGGVAHRQDDAAGFLRCEFGRARTAICSS